jgi:hypothetical protein
MFGTVVHPLFDEANAPTKMRMWNLPYSHRIVFTGDKGQFELTGSTLTELGRGQDLGRRVYLVEESPSPGDRTLFVLTDKGLYSLLDQKATLLATETELLAATENIKPGKADPVSNRPSEGVTGRRIIITKSSDGRVILFVGKGAVAVYGGTSSPLAAMEDYGDVAAIFPAGARSDYLRTDRGVVHLLTGR